MRAYYGRRNEDGELIRTRLLVVLMLAALAGLAVRLYLIQVVEGSRYEDKLRSQSVRRVRLPGIRGRILDRNGAVLADNRPSYGVAVYLEELALAPLHGPTTERIRGVIDVLSGLLISDPSVGDRDISLHWQRRRPLPLIAWKDLSDRDLARFAEAGSRIPGIGISVDAVRVYPEPGLASHVVGYVGLTNEIEDEDPDYNYYRKEMIGRSGVERSMDDLLRGQSGGEAIRVDVRLLKRHEIWSKPPRPGHDVKLALDMKAQRLAEAALADAAGAIVVVDPRNGDVLAMASSPSFDLNTFVPHADRTAYQALLDNPDRPLFPRPTHGAYTPGSIFKPIVALAALENGLVDPDETFFCPGHYQLGRRRIRCWLARGHGDMNLRSAIKHSCNVYFFHIGRRIGPAPIAHMASACGLGRPTGIELSAESSGILPDEAWKRRQLGEGWYEGDTCNLSIGQGPLTVTPLQMAMVASALANEGVLYRPRMVLGVKDTDSAAYEIRPPVVTNRLQWSDRSMKLVRGGMYDAVMGQGGTGRLARIPGIDVAGKTGTAQWGPPGLGKKRGWMIAFAPFDQPRYAIAAVVDDAEGGGADAGPRIQRVLAGLFDVPLTGAADG